MQSIPAQIFDTAARLPESAALIDAGDVVTYAELAERVSAGGRGLLAAGVRHGDRVALWAPNSARWIVAALSIQSIGGVMVPINTRYKTGEAIYPIERTGARLLIAENGFMDIDGRRAADEAGVELIDLGQWGSLIERGVGVDHKRWEDALAAVGPDDLCDVMFTSGSTGKPKGVRHRHGPTVRQSFNSIEENSILEGDRLLIVNPFFHVFGYTGGWVLGLFSGATVYPLPTFEVGQVLSMIESERITYFPGPPTIFHSILDDPRLATTDVSSLRGSLTGASDVPVSMIEQMLTRLTFERVIQAYGMTECGTSTNTVATDSPEIVATTVGKASKDFEVAIADTENNHLPPNEPGEIVVRGYAVMDGYYDDPEATAATIDTDGWLHTGDRGSLDEHGYVRILGRIKDMLIVGGFNVYPAEVENMIREHPDVDDVALIGVPDARMGEVGCAFVVAGQPIELTEFVAWCREKMANFKVPRHLELVDALPLTGSNKVSKVELREIAAARRIGAPQ
ncbi:MAG: acyl-CoA synthetase (AMP-forming)/AMP-acid ligase II [Acidimicrobiales bacterium]|jgi:HIP---CoA ligase